MTFETYVEGMRDRMNSIVLVDNDTVNVDSVKDAKQAFAEICNGIVNGNNNYENMKNFLKNVTNSLIHDEGGKINHILDDSINAVVTETLSRYKTSGLVSTDVKDDKKAEVIKEEKKEEKVEEKAESKKDEKTQKLKNEKKEGNPKEASNNKPAQIGSCVNMPLLSYCSEQEKSIVMNRIKDITETIKSGNSKWDKAISEAFSNLTLVHFWNNSNDFILKNVRNKALFWVSPKKSVMYLPVNDPEQIRVEHDEFVRTLNSESAHNTNTKSA